MSDIMAQPPQPVNYTGMQVQADPVNSFLRASQAQAQIGLLGAQQGLIQQQSQIAQAQAQRQQQYNDQLQQFRSNPTPQAAAQLAMSLPELASNVSNAWNQHAEAVRQQKLDQYTPVYSSLLNGRADLATNLVQQHINAIQNTPDYENNSTLQQDLSGAQNLLKMIQSDQQNGTKNAQAYMGATMAAAMGPQDFLQHIGQGSTVPAAIETANIAPAQAAANVGQTVATTQDLQSIIQNRAAQFGLDQNRFQTDVNLKLRELNYLQNAPNMAPATRAQADQDAADSVAHGQMAERIGTLAQNVGALDQSGQWAAGKPEDIRAGWQNFWGNQDQLNTIRNEYQSVMGTLGAFGGAGVSKEDQKNLAPGIPGKNADASQVTAFLQSFQNASLRAARMTDAKSSWAYSFGRLGPATQDANIGGIEVAKGTTFPQFMAQMLKAGSTAPSPFAAPNAPAGVQINPQQQTGAPAQPAGALDRYAKYLTP
jgi:hypothetical protein